MSAPDAPPAPPANGAPPERRRSFYFIGWLFYLALAIAAVLWLGAQRGHLGLELFVEPGTWWIDLGAGIGAGLILLALWGAAERLSSAARELEAKLAALVGPMPRAEALALALLSAVAEELFFRGALQGAIGLLPAALLFALLHSGPGRAFRLWGLFALVAGALLGFLVAEREALAGAIVAHAIVNAVHLDRLARRALVDSAIRADAAPRGPRKEP